MRAEGGASIIAHPRRRHSFDKITELVQHVDGIEIWNRKVDGLLPVRSYFKFARDCSLATTVGMDLHTQRQIFPMWNIVAADNGPLDGKGIATALRDRTIMPAWLMGSLSPGLDRGVSVGVGTLAAAETLRRLLKGLRNIGGWAGNIDDK